MSEAFAQRCARAPFDQLARFAPMFADGWPSLASLSEALAQTWPVVGSAAPRFVEQTPALLAEGLHYEQRIAQRREIATRAGSWHDLYSALMWLRFPRVKQAVNTLQMRGIDEHGTKQRSRHQQAITHLDEAGAWLVSCNAELFELADAHQWAELFYHRRSAWRGEIDAHVFGHAIFELLHQPHQTLAAKAVLLEVPPAFMRLTRLEQERSLDGWVSDALLDLRAGADPKDMLSLPLSGIPGWRAENSDLVFVQSAPCFRGRPEGRRYGAILKVAS